MATIVKKNNAAKQVAKRKIKPSAKTGKVTRAMAARAVRLFKEETMMSSESGEVSKTYRQRTL
jgi:hypothetical protein